MSEHREKLKEELSKIVNFIMTSTHHPLGDEEKRWVIADYINRAMMMSRLRTAKYETGPTVSVKEPISDPKETLIYKFAMVLKDKEIKSFEAFSKRIRQISKGVYNGKSILNKWQKIDWKVPFNVPLEPFTLAPLNDSTVTEPEPTLTPWKEMHEQINSLQSKVKTLEFAIDELQKFSIMHQHSIAGSAIMVKRPFFDRIKE
jgi:hypothetical protein